MPEPISSTDRRVRVPDPEIGPPAVARSRGGWFWALFPLAGFALFGAVVWLAYKDVSRGPPVGEPPLVKAAADPIKLPPEEAADSTAEEGGTIGRLWSDAENADQPERLLPLPEEPLSPEAVASPDLSTTLAEEATAPDLPSPSTALSSGEAAAGDREAGRLASPADAPASPSSERDALADADAALDRLLAEVTALSEEAPTSTEAPLTPTEEAAAPPSEESPAAREASPSSTLGRASPDQPTGAASAARAEPLAQVPGTTSTGARGAAAIEPPVSPPRPAAPAPDAASVAAPAPATRVAALEDRFRIQVAAVRAEADARRAWRQFEQELGPILSEVQPFFERAETANGIFYRVQIGRFETQQAAESLCAEIKQRDASCFVVRR